MSFHQCREMFVQLNVLCLGNRKYAFRLSDRGLSASGMYSSQFIEREMMWLATYYMQRRCAVSLCNNQMGDFTVS